MDTMKPKLFDLDIETKEKEDQTIAEVTIEGVIGEDPWSLEDDQNTKQVMREQLREVDSIEADKIVVNISSLGGDVDHGLAIHDLLASNAATVETNVTGMTASAATIIAQAGEVRKMSDNALYLIHRAWTIGMGNANDFEVLAKDLNTLDDRISNIYAKRSEADQEAFLELMNEANGDGIWLSAAEAKERGLIDQVVEPMKAAAAVSKEMLEKYNLPKPDSYKDSEKESNKSFQQGFQEAFSKAIRVAIRAGDISLDVGHTEVEDDVHESANATSRERLELELLKLKQ